MALAEATEKEHETHEQVRGVTEFFTPFFLVSIGMQLNLEAFTSRETIVASLVITVLAVATKFVGCGLASIRLGLRSEEHTSELQSLMRISYAVLCLIKKIKNTTQYITSTKSW